jgi:3-dehydroquinate synthase
MFSQVRVDLGQRSYKIRIGCEVLNEVGEHALSLKLGKKCVVITDDRVGPLYAERVLQSLRLVGIESLLLTVPSGETSKSLTVAENLLEKMTSAGLDRGSFVVALGGGVVGDLAGFVASIYFRGIPYIQIPTTVLAQVDSSVGGKTGVNLRSGKNLVGSFHQPRAVLVDIAVLETLPPREFNEGFAEIIKHAVIRDATLFQRLQNFDRSDTAELTAIIQRNIEIKAAIVSEDEHETLGLRALLNFGHTIGHGIENAAGYGTLLHGEAISLGMVAAARLSVAKAEMPTADCEAMIALLARFGLPTELPESIATESILQALAKDKKFYAGQIRFVLSPAIGSAFLSNTVTLNDIKNQIEALRVL